MTTYHDPLPWNDQRNIENADRESRVSDMIHSTEGSDLSKLSGVDVGDQETDTDVANKRSSSLNVDFIQNEQDLMAVTYVCVLAKELELAIVRIRVDYELFNSERKQVVEKYKRLIALFDKIISRETSDLEQSESKRSAEGEKNEDGTPHCCWKKCVGDDSDKSDEEMKFENLEDIRHAVQESEYEIRSLQVKILKLIAHQREAAESFAKITSKLVQISSRTMDHNEKSEDIRINAQDENVDNGKKMAEKKPNNQLDKEIKLLELVLDKGSSCLYDLQDLAEEVYSSDVIEMLGKELESKLGELLWEVKKNALQLKREKTKELMEERANTVKHAEEWRYYKKFVEEWRDYRKFVEECMGLKNKNKISWFFPAAASATALIGSAIALLIWFRQKKIK